MTDQNNNGPTSGAVETLRSRVVNAIKSADQESLIWIRRKDARITRKAPKRVKNAIDAIPKKISRNSKAFLTGSPEPCGGFDCKARIMDLKDYEYVVDPAACSEDHCQWEIREPETSQLRFAAKSVFDYCEQAGLNPKVERILYRSTWGPFARYYLRIYWNLPEEMKTSPR